MNTVQTNFQWWLLSFYHSVSTNGMTSLISGQKVWRLHESFVWYEKLLSYHRAPFQHHGAVWYRASAWSGNFFIQSIYFWLSFLNLNQCTHVFLKPVFGIKITIHEILYILMVLACIHFLIYLHDSNFFAVIFLSLGLINTHNFWHFQNCFGIKITIYRILNISSFLLITEWR